MSGILGVWNVEGEAVPQDLLFAELGDFKLESGEVIRDFPRSIR